MSSNKVVLTPLIGMMEKQPKHEVEWFTIEEIKKHRRLRDDVSQLDAKIGATSDCPSRSEIERDYILALIAMHAQQTVVSTMIGILGYIPDIPADTTH